MSADAYNNRCSSKVEGDFRHLIHEPAITQLRVARAGNSEVGRGAVNTDRGEGHESDRTVPATRAGPGDDYRP